MTMATLKNLGVAARGVPNAKNNRNVMIAPGETKTVNVHPHIIDQLRRDFERNGQLEVVTSGDQFAEWNASDESPMMTLSNAVKDREATQRALDPQAVLTTGPHNFPQQSKFLRGPNDMVSEKNTIANPNLPAGARSEALEQARTRAKTALEVAVQAEAAAPEPVGAALDSLAGLGDPLPGQSGSQGDPQNAPDAPAAPTAAPLPQGVPRTAQESIPPGQARTAAPAPTPARTQSAAPPASSQSGGRGQAKSKNR